MKRLRKIRSCLHAILLSFRAFLLLLVLAAAARGDILWEAAGHGGEINAVALSSDGSLLASASDDQTVRLWRMPDGALARTYKGHRDDVQAVAFSPDGLTLVSSGKDNAVKVWRTDTGELLRTLPGIGFPVGEAEASPRHPMALSPDGTLVACSQNFEAGGGADTLHTTVVQIRRLADGTLLRTLVQQETSPNGSRPSGAVAFSPDGTLVAADVGSSVFLSRTADGGLVRLFSGHTLEVQSVAFSPDGQTLASASSDATIKLWRVADGTLLQTCTGHGMVIRSVAWSPDGRHVASASFDTTLRLWNALDGQQVWRAQDPTDYRFRTVAFSPDGQWLASGNRDFSVALYNTATGAKTATLTAHAGAVNAIVFSPDETIVASASSGNWEPVINFWRVADGSLLWRVAPAATTWGAAPFALAPDGQTVACLTSTSGGQVELRRARDGVLVQRIGANLPVGPIVFSPDGLTLAVGGTDWWITLWRLSDGARVASFLNDSGGVQDLAFCPDGRLLAEVSRKNEVQLRRLADGTVIHLLPGRLLGFSREGDRVAVARFTQPVVGAYQVADGRLLTEVGPSRGGVEFLAMAPDWSAAVGEGNDDLQSWRMADGALWRSFTEEVRDVTSCAISPRGTYLAFGRADTALLLANNVLTPIESVPRPPVIDVAPQDLTLDGGGEGAFWVAARGGTPLSWQWSFNQTPIAGATNRCLVLQAVERSQAGPYQVVVSDGEGNTTSASATLRVSVPPRIVTPPASQTVNTGATVALQVAAEGEGPILYQWRFNEEPLPGQTNATLKLADVEPGQSGSYSVVVSQPTGSCVSAAAELTVQAPVQVRWQTRPTPIESYLCASALSFSPDGTRLVLALSEVRYRQASDEYDRRLNAVFAWDVTNAAAARWTLVSSNFQGPPALALSPRLDWLALRDHSAGIGLYRLPPLDAPLADGPLASWTRLAATGLIAGSSDGRTVAVAGEYDVALWQVPETQRKTALPTGLGWNQWEGFTALSPDGTRLALAKHDAVIELWHTGGEMTSLVIEGNSVWRNTAAFSPDGALLATGGDNRVIKLWRTDDGSLRRVLAGPFFAVRCLGFSPSGAVLAAGYDDDLRLWRVSDGQPLPAAWPQSGGPQCLAFSPVGGLFAWLRRNGEVVLVENPFAAMDLAPLRFEAVGISPGGDLQFSVSGPESGRFVIQISPDLEHWTDWTSGSFDAERVQMTDPAPASLPRRFYRLIAPPASPRQ